MAAGEAAPPSRPDFRESVFPGLHHFAPPFREQPEELADVLRIFWLAA